MDNDLEASDFSNQSSDAIEDMSLIDENESEDNAGYESDSSLYTENLNQDIVNLRQEALDLHQEILDLRQNIVDLRSLYGRGISYQNSDDENDDMIIEPVINLCTDNDLHEDKNNVNSIIYEENDHENISFLSDREPFIQCKICLNSATNNMPIATTCGHIFCKTCILGAFKIKPYCPVCRRIISMQDLIKLCL